MPPQDSTICYLLRHGATENNERTPPVLQGQRLDAALSAAGRRQAEATGRFLAEWTIDAVYCSPLLRARQTAEAIAAPHALPVEIVEELIEVDVGEWEGLTWDEIRQNDPAAYEAFTTDAAANPYLGGECFREVLDRSGPAIDALLRRNLGRSIVVVAHNVVNRAYLARVIGIPLAEYRRIAQDNCGLSVIRFTNERTRATTINSVFHLDGYGEA